MFAEVIKVERMKATMLNPPLASWEKLYAAAIEFKKTGCWEWMDDRHIFGVQNPVSGEIGYCVVLGSMGEVFALAVYRGTEGLEGITRIHTGMIELELEESIQVQNCLIASFEDRNDLQEQDREVIKKLGLKFRGRKEWPLFRSLQPGYVPWFINKEEGAFLIVALQQAREVVLRVKEKPNLLATPSEEHYFVRTAEKKGRKISWSDCYMKPHPIVQEEPLPYNVDELRLKRIKKAATRRDIVLEVDFFYAPYPVQEKKGQRPFFPYLCLWVDRNSGLVLKHSLAGHKELEPVFRDNFINLLEDIQAIPSALLVRQEQARKILEPLAGGLGIEISMLKRLKKMDEVRESMFDHFSR